MYVCIYVSSIQVQVEIRQTRVRASALAPRATTKNHCISKCPYCSNQDYGIRRCQCPATYCISSNILKQNMIWAFIQLGYSRFTVSYTTLLPVLLRYGLAPGQGRVLLNPRYVGLTDSQLDHHGSTRPRLHFGIRIEILLLCITSSVRLLVKYKVDIKISRRLLAAATRIGMIKRKVYL